MTLLALDDPVFVIDLTPATMAACAADFDRANHHTATDAAPTPPGPPPAPALPIRALALVLDWQQDPVLLPLSPTRDTVMLDALARLLRAALLTGRSLQALATGHGDATLRRLYRQRAFPPFVYYGLATDSLVTARLPPALQAALTGSPRH